MRRLYIMLFCMYSLTSLAQFHSGHICSRSVNSLGNAPNPDQELSSRSIESDCSLIHLEQFAYLTRQELFQYLTTTDAPFTCITRVLTGYNSVYSRVVFSDENVNYISQFAIGYFANYNGNFDNGSHGLIAYLSIAAQKSRYYTDIEYSEATWNYLEQACATMAINPAILNVNELNFWILGELYITASDDHISGNPNIVYLTYRLLDNLAKDSYATLTDYYSYYYCYYYILEVYLLYAPNNSEYITSVSNDARLIYALTDVIENDNLNEDTYVYFDDLISASIDALAGHASYAALENVVGDALNDVVDKYDLYSTEWVIASLAIVENGLDSAFPYTEQEILDNLESDQFPNTFQFENGKIEISTPLGYEEVLPLYEAAEIVRAQFFRMIGTDDPLDNDPNEKLKIKVFGSMSEYQDLNVLLYGVDYPNSGGVYIEDLGTFYTYQRTPEESDYTLEELFRHEYVHYLQARYIVEGTWGQSSAYENQRLVWFEEGMAQFLAASTRHHGVKNLNVVRYRLENYQDYQGLDQIFDSSYSSGNSDAYYTFAPMLWSDWYNNNRNMMYELCGHLRDNDLTSFDNLVDQYRVNSSNNARYINHIEQSITNNSLWISPQTEFLHQEDVDPCTESQLLDEILGIDPTLQILHTEEDFEGDQARYIVDLFKSFSTPEYSITELKKKVDTHLDNILYGAEVFSPCNNFDFSKGYYTDAVTGANPRAMLQLSLRLNGSCNRYNTDQFHAYPNGNSIVFTITSTSHIHQFRYREVPSSAWVAAVPSGQATDVVTAFIDPSSSYEYQVRRECSPGVWSDYSDIKVFHPCPDSREFYTSSMDEDNTYQAANYIKTSSSIMSNTHIDFKAGQYVTLLPSFTMNPTSSIVIEIEDCRSE